MGDRSKQVRITNATGVTIFLDEGTVSSATPANQIRLAAGETRTNAWLAPLSPGDRPRLVQARAENNDVLFCERFTFEELQAIDWRIEITRGHPLAGESCA
jgi:hypothetical protein